MPLLPGHIRYYRWCEPPLAADKYTLKVDQFVPELESLSITDNLQFTVAGPRFSLNPSDIYCVYPPKGEMADFANALPHVVFTRRTLPWERAPEPGKEPKADKPWMALLLFSGDEIPKIKPMKVKELLARETSRILRPQIARIEAYEEAETCNTIEVPLESFRRAAPTATDLKYLAHVREVKTDAKETLSFLSDGWFSVVIGNRFPEPQKPAGGTSKTKLAMENQVFLVSLEGVLSYLPGATPVVEGSAVRLAVLASWSFHCTEAFSFKALMSKLSSGALRLEPETNAAAGTPEKYVADAVRMGYVPLNQHTRLGERTVSWYRGPLSPILTEERRYSFNSVPDSLLRYDPSSGMMDVTYSAAFQLGRLLGLQDRAFARALTAWREGQQMQFRERFRRQALYRVIRPDAPDRFDPNQSLLDVFAASIGVKEASQSATPKSFDGEGSEPPDSVRQWLARLILLYRVPFHYLIPNPRMLPDDSIRFFSLDPGWINCLLEGACSVGRDNADEAEADEILRDQLLTFGFNSTPKVRRRPESPFAEADSDAPDNQAARATWPMDGFLMRSALVGGWQGLEMRAWKDWAGDPTKMDGPNALHGVNPVAPLRIDRLSSTVMLCIFNGPVGLIEVHEPPEGLHFGAHVDVDKQVYSKSGLRWLDDKPGHTPGGQIPGNPMVDIPFRSAASQRTIDFATLAERIQKKIGAADPFTSAEMAVEMTESPGRIYIRRTKEGQP